MLAEQKEILARKEEKQNNLKRLVEKLLEREGTDMTQYSEEIQDIIRMSINARE